ncbi:MAG: hypothetical protein JST53_17995 [Actinobacteria bacterium]|nr:hypothetical protein [Actinomycetota bacterium]
MAVGLGVLALAATDASAYSGEFAKFNNCPVKTTGVFKCVLSVTNGGNVILGKKNVPIKSPVTLQGGFSKPNEAGVSSFFGATNGVTLSKSPQAVPGGLLGIVPPESSPPLVKALSAFFFENGLTGVNATLELAKPASEIQLSEINLVGEEQTALKLPVMVHLENPFLGKSCYVGSSSSPLIWNLTTGVTAPPPPNTSIHGSAGEGEFKEEGRIFELHNTQLVENSWSAPTASGCGGILSFLVNPIINSQIGLASSAGKNTTNLENTTIDLATATAVINHP